MLTFRLLQHSRTHSDITKIGHFGNRKYYGALYLEFSYLAESKTELFDEFFLKEHKNTDFTVVVHASSSLIEPNTQFTLFFDSSHRTDNEQCTKSKVFIATPEVVMPM